MGKKNRSDLTIQAVSTSEGIRTPVSALRGPRARPLHNGGKYGWGTRIRTLNDRVRAERVTVTPFPIGFRSGLRSTAKTILPQRCGLVNTFFLFFLHFLFRIFQGRWQRISVLDCAGKEDFEFVQFDRTYTI